MIKSIKKLFSLFGDRKNTKEIARWLFGLGKNFKRYIFIFLIINLITMLMSLASAVAGRYVVDAATGFKTDLFVRYIAIMLGTTLFSILISMVANMFSGYVNEKFAFQVRADMFDRVQRSAWHRISQYHSGDMLSRLTADVDMIASNLISIIPSTIVTGCQLIIVLCILLKYDPTLALIGLIVGPLGFLTATVSRKKYSVYQERLRESHSEYYSFMQESLSHIGVVKTFQLEKANGERFDAFRKKRMQLVIKSAALGNVMGSLMRLIYSLGYVAAFSWCAYRLTTASTVIDPSGVEVATYTYGTMTLFLSLVSQIQSSIRGLGGAIPKVYSLMVCAKRVREITELEAEDYAGGSEVPRQVGVRAEHISFAYETEKGTVLNDISFRISPGMHVGIVGTSGVGKTTFIRLLLSLIQPNGGVLAYVDENGAEEIACPASRRFISYVPQGNTLLSGTVRTNLQAGKPNATDEEMWSALETADAADFLKKMADGLDTVLAERAGGLSEGQAQRIAIARALLRDKPVLILDEATSALDEKTEAKMFERITAECQKTCFIITHRRSMLQYCDCILEIDDEGGAVFYDNRPQKE